MEGMNKEARVEWAKALMQKARHEEKDRKARKSHQKAKKNAKKDVSVTKPGTQPNSPKAPKPGRSAAALFKNHGLLGKAASSSPATSKVEESLATTYTEVVGDHTQGGTSDNMCMEENIKEEVDESIKEEVDESIKEEVDESIKEEVDESIKGMDAKMFGGDTKCNEDFASGTIKVLKVAETEVLEPATPACDLSRNTSFLPVARHYSGDISTEVTPGIKTADEAITPEAMEAAPGPSSSGIPLGCWVVGLAGVGVAATAAVAITCGYVGFNVSLYAGSSLCRTVLRRVWSRGR